MLSLQPSLELLGKTDDLLVQRDILHGQLFQLVKQGEGFLFGQLPAVDSLDRLVVVHPYTAVVALQVRQPDVEVRGRLVDPHHFQRLAEDGREDELRPGLRTGICVEPLELDVLPFVQTEPVIIGMELGCVLRLTPASSGLGRGHILRFLCLFDSCHISSVSLRLFFREQNK